MHYQVIRYCKYAYRYKYEYMNICTYIHYLYKCTYISKYIHILSGTAHMHIIYIHTNNYACTYIFTRTCKTIIKLYVCMYMHNVYAAQCICKYCRALHIHIYINVYKLYTHANNACVCGGGGVCVWVCVHLCL